MLIELDELRESLSLQTAGPAPWIGLLRRSFRATAWASSTAIEGFSVPAAAATALVGGEQPDPHNESQLAVAAYARAMDHVAVMALDPTFRWLDRVILDLHFDACSFQRDQEPGRWRTGPISVTGPDADLAYRGPDANDVPALMAESVEWLDAGDPDTHVAVRAAMAHLHVVSVHPFRDGNGRVSRIVQSLVLARDGLLAAELCSIEEYLGRHTTAYYDALHEVRGGSYQPERDAAPWVDFCLRAHLEQARRRLLQIEEAARRWDRLEALVADRGWPDRLVIALEQSLFGRTDRSQYAREAGVSPATASADLRRLLDGGLLTAHGRGRGAHYQAGRALRDRLE